MRTARGSVDLPPAGRLTRPLEALVVCAGSAVALGAAAGSREVVLAGCGVLLAVLAARSVEAFLLVALAVRATLDHFRADSLLSPASLLGAAVIGLVVATELRARWRGAPRRPLDAPFRVPLQLLVAVSVVSSLVSDDVLDSGAETLRLAAVLAMVVGLERWAAGPAAARRVLVAVYVSAVVPLLLAVQQLVAGGGREIGGFSRVIGTFLHPNPFSIYLTLLLVTGVALLPHLRGRVRWAMVAVVAVASVDLLFTYTRGSWLAALVGVTVVGVAQGRRVVLGALAVAVAVAVSVPSVSARFSDLSAPVTYSGGTSNSLVWRMDYWRDVVALSSDSPVLGIGPKGIERAEPDAKNAHDDPVREYVETGLLGLAAYLALAWSLVGLARRALRAPLAGWRRGAAVGVAGSVAALAVVSVSSNVITQVVLLWYVVALAMVAVAVTTHRGSPYPDLPGARTAGEVDRQ